MQCFNLNFFPLSCKSFFLVFIFNREAVVSVFLPHTDISGEYELSINKEKTSNIKQEVASGVTETVKTSSSKNIKTAPLTFKIPKVSYYEFSFRNLFHYLSITVNYSVYLESEIYEVI